MTEPLILAPPRWENGCVLADTAMPEKPRIRIRCGRRPVTWVTAIADVVRADRQWRSKAAIEAARAAGRLIGRPPTLDMEDQFTALNLFKKGVPVWEIAANLYINKSTVYRILHSNGVQIRRWTRKK